jgi:hypothetical protein
VICFLTKGSELKINERCSAAEQIRGRLQKRNRKPLRRLGQATVAMILQTIDAN